MTDIMLQIHLKPTLLTPAAGLYLHRRHRLVKTLYPLPLLGWEGARFRRGGGRRVHGEGRGGGRGTARSEEVGVQSGFRILRRGGKTGRCVGRKASGR